YHHILVRLQAPQAEELLLVAFAEPEARRPAIGTQRATEAHAGEGTLGAAILDPHDGMALPRVIVESALAQQRLRQPLRMGQLGDREPAAGVGFRPEPARPQPTDNSRLLTMR